MFEGRPRFALTELKTRAVFSQVIGQPGVYALYTRDGEILYVGQSSDLATRLAQHKRDPSKAAAVAFAFVPETSLDKRLELEGIEILRRRPPLNNALLIRVARGRLYEIRYRRSPRSRRR